MEPGGQGRPMLWAGGGAAREGSGCRGPRGKRGPVAEEGKLGCFIFSSPLGYYAVGFLFFPSYI